MNRDRRDFRIELNNFLRLSSNSNVDTILDHITKTSFTDTRNQNIVFQYLKKVAKQNEIYYPQIREFLHTLKRSRFKTFKINISDAFHSGYRFEGSLEIIINGVLILPKVHITAINIYAFLTSLEHDVNIKDKLSPEESMSLFVGGCGIHGCCPAFYWNVKHDNEIVEIDEIFWYGQAYEPEKYNEYIEGNFKVFYDDYYSEIKRLESISNRSIEKTNVIPWKKPTKKYIWLQQLKKMGEMRQRKDEF
jgi:hypothetical protein